MAEAISAQFSTPLERCHCKVRDEAAGIEVQTPLVVVSLAPIIGTVAKGKVITGAVTFVGFPEASVKRVTEILLMSVDERILFPSVYVALTPNSYV